jgi:hypothetical protein
MLGGNTTQELFLSTANRQRDFGRERKRFFSACEQTPESDEAFAIISDALPRDLSRHVSAWIASGYNQHNGTEEPRRRKLDFKGRNSVEGWLRLQESSTITVSNKGEIRLDLSSFKYGGLPIAEPEEYAGEEASRMFLWLLNEGELRYAVAQCKDKDCRRFYFRAKPRGFYKRATFCPDCRHKASVSRRMKVVRELKEKAVIDAAIRAHRKWLQLSPRLRARFREEKTYIVGQIGKEFGVTGNWLTRHWHQILQDQHAPQPFKAVASEGGDR